MGKKKKKKRIYNFSFLHTNLGYSGVFHHKKKVKDVSGGCGSMYAIEIASERFVGLSLVRQHRLVHDILGEEVKAWHGVQLRTSVA